MLNCIWKELQLLRLAAACSKIAWTSVEVGTHCLFPEHSREYQSKPLTDHSSNERSYEIVQVHFAEKTGDRY